MGIPHGKQTTSSIVRLEATVIGSVEKGRSVRQYLKRIWEEFFETREQVLFMVGVESVLLVDGQ